MTRPITLVFGSLLSALAFACSGSDEPPPEASLTPTFTNVAKTVINSTNCGGTLCHTATAGGFALGSKDKLHGALVDKPATGAKCSLPADAGAGAQPLILVVPGDPDQSLLYMKLTARQPCGETMPATDKQLSQAQIQLVRDWIADGAKND